MRDNRLVASVKQYFIKVIHFLVTVTSILLLYQIVFGGQYSIASYLQAKKANKIALNRNQAQVTENDQLAYENYKIQTDVELQKKLSKELGYMEKGEQIIKRTD